MSDWNLERFVEAQDRGGVYEAARAELSAGRKRTHWMWFVFPQLAGLGQSPTSRHFAISGLDEARAYLAHPVLGPRLRDAVQLLRTLEARSAEEIFGGIDAIKLRSSLTLFHAAAPDEPLFDQVLRQFFDGPDERTLELLERAD